MIRFCASLFAVCCALMGAVEPVDFVIGARYVVTMDGARRVIGNGAVAVRGERIVAVGTQSEIGKQFKAKRQIHSSDGILMPGLINTHTHAPMVLFRGIADDLRLQEWLEKFIFPAEAKNVTPAFVRWGTKLACAEMLLSGTTTYADMYYFEEVVADATKECGMRGVLGQTVIGFPAPDAKTQSEALAHAESFIRRFEHDPLIVPAIAPHSPYTVPDELMKASRALANRYGVPMLIHLSETKRENEEMQAKRGMSPTKALESLGALTGRTLAAHGVWVDDEDMRLLKARNVGVAHCPSSNMKLASGVAPVVKYLAEDVAIGLGTDGAAGSNNDLDLLEEADLAGKLQKVTSGDPRVLPALQAIEMATIRGARALGLEKEIGSLESGKRADLITIRITGPHAIPMYNVYSHLASVLKGSDVRDVMVNGRLVVRDRKLLTLEVEQVKAKALEIQRSVEASLH